MLAGTFSYELEDFVGAKFYYPHVFADGNQRIWIREKMLQFSSAVLVWYGMVYVDLYSAIITKVSNALDTLVSGEKPGFQTLSERLVVLLCAEVVRQRVPYHGAVHSECSASDSG